MIDLAVAAVFKDESRYIREWVDWHRYHGARLFYLVYDDISEEELNKTRQVLKEYIDSGEVIIAQNTPLRINRQHDGYNKAMWEIGDRCKWIAFLDVDEYLLPTSNLSVIEVLRLFDLIDSIGCIYVSLATFGTSFLTEPPASRIRSFIRRATKNHPFNQRGKLIVKPWRTWAHTPTKIADHDGRLSVPTVYPFKVYTTMRRVITYRDFATVCWNLLRINHYESGSEQCWYNKANKGRVSVNGKIDHGLYDKRKYSLFVEANEQEDLSALEHIDVAISR